KEDIVKETVEYTDLDNYVCKFVLTRDKVTNNIRTIYLIDNDGNILSSEWSEYDEFGIRVAHAVAGIDGTPVRCPNWDRDNACYYKMSVLYPFSDKARRNMVSATAFNEFGETSYFQKDNNCISISETPYNYSNTEMMGNKTVMSIAKTDVQGNVSHFSALFIHVLSKKGTFYNAKSLSNVDDGLKDGDILIRVGSELVFPSNNTNMEATIIERLQASGGTLLIARPNPAKDTYSLLKYKVSAENCGAELHLMNLTKTENKRLTSSIKQ
ncbi:MAG: hypothetical protein LUC91_09500, partial [Prevotella sp.]|nr:hypothetical protein [Prevotella sp.]